MIKKIGFLLISLCLLSACHIFSNHTMTEAVVTPVPRHTLPADATTLSNANTGTKPATNSTHTDSQLVPAPAASQSGQVVVPNVAPALGE